MSAFLSLVALTDLLERLVAKRLPKRRLPSRSMGDRRTGIAGGTVDTRAQRPRGRQSGQGLPGEEASAVGRGQQLLRQLGHLEREQVSDCSGASRQPARDAVMVRLLRPHRHSSQAPSHLSHSPRTKGREAKSKRPSTSTQQEHGFRKAPCPELRPHPMLACGEINLWEGA